MNLNIILQYLILHLQTKCGYACSDQLRSTLAPSLVHADIYTFLAPHGVRQDTAHRSPLVRFETQVWGHSLTSLMQRVLLKIRTRTSILRTSQFLNCHCRSIDPDLIALAALISLMSLVSLTCLNFLSSPSQSRWSSVDIIRGRFRDRVDRSRSCNVYPRFVTACFREYQFVLSITLKNLIS